MTAVGYIPSHLMLHMHKHSTDNTHLNNFNWAGRQLSEWQVTDGNYKKRQNQTQKQHNRCTIIIWGEANKIVRQV